MRKYKICDRCGSSLDFGETCDCAKEVKEEDLQEEAATPQEKQFEAAS